MESSNKLRIKIPTSEVIGNPKESEPDEKTKKTQSYNCLSLILNLFRK